MSDAWLGTSGYGDKMIRSRYYGAAGVYLEKEYAGGVAQTSAGMLVLVGLAAKGPIGTPTRLRRWSDYERVFGPPAPGTYLAHAVRGYFSNVATQTGSQARRRVRDAPPSAWDTGRDNAPFRSLDVTGCQVVRMSEIAESTLRATLARLEGVARIDLICAPDLACDPASMVELQKMVVAHCHHAGDRFAVLDAHPDANADRSVLMVQRSELQGPDSGSAALYFPWIGVSGHQVESGNYLLVPPCGHVAGVYARSDARYGMQRAPANEELTQVVDVGMDLSAADQAQLNPAGFAAVNCLRAFPGRGVRVWGARTLSTEPQWTQVSVRRLFIAMGRWLERNMSDLVYEPHDARLRSRITGRLKSYLGDLHTQGALKGATPEQAYYIKCDEETNPVEVRDAGQVVTELGVAPVVPGEFIVVRLVNADRGVMLTPASRSAAQRSIPAPSMIAVGKLGGTSPTP